MMMEQNVSQPEGSVPGPSVQPEGVAQNSENLPVLLPQSATAQHPFASDNDLQVGMVLFPDSLYVDPVIKERSTQEYNQWTSNQKAESVRLWANFFAPLGKNSGVDIPTASHDFFIMSLLNPSKFEWARSFLGSEAWKLILRGKLSKAPLVVTEVRRSERIKSKSDGFKVASCQSKVYFCGSTEAPTLSDKVI
jgi:hypothetical protein